MCVFDYKYCLLVVTNLKIGFLFMTQLFRLRRGNKKSPESGAFCVYVGAYYLLKYIFLREYNS
jgi:hypothetical protein